MIFTNPYEGAGDNNNNETAYSVHFMNNRKCWLHCVEKPARLCESSSPVNSPQNKNKNQQVTQYTAVFSRVPQDRHKRPPPCYHVCCRQHVIGEPLIWLQPVTVTTSGDPQEARRNTTNFLLFRVHQVDSNAERNAEMINRRTRLHDSRPSVRFHGKKNAKNKNSRRSASVGWRGMGFDESGMLRSPRVLKRSESLRWKPFTTVLVDFT